MFALSAVWAEFKDLIFLALKSIHDVVGDWGMSIIVLTALFRLVLIPLTVKQTRSMYEMQRIQPKIKELQKKYADDKEKLQEETLKFYQENKVNPFGGCLPLILQMPIFFALYQVLGRTSKGGPGVLLKYLASRDEIGSFYFFISNIANTPKAVFAEQGLLAVIPYALLVVIFGLSVWLPQALMPGEKQQKMIGLYMAVVMLFFGWNSPAGVLLYWDVSSIWGVAQQQLMTRSMKKHETEEPEPVQPSARAAQGKGKKAGGKKKSKSQG